jgi:hypothetical protein
MTFSPKVTTYDLLAQRVRRALGEPYFSGNNMNIEELKTFLRNKINDLNNRKNLAYMAGGQQINDHWNGHISYCIRFYSSLTNNIFLDVKNLTARTIGTGLNLI